MLRPTDDEHGNLHPNALRRYPGLRPAVEEKPLPLLPTSLLIPQRREHRENPRHFLFHTEFLRRTAMRFRTPRLPTVRIRVPLNALWPLLAPSGIPLDRSSPGENAQLDSNGLAVLRLLG